MKTRSSTLELISRRGVGHPRPGIRAAIAVAVTLAVAAGVGVSPVSAAAAGAEDELSGVVAHFPLNATTTYSDALGGDPLPVGSAVAFRPDHVSLINSGNSNNGHIAGATPATAKVTGDGVSFSFDSMLEAAQSRATNADRAILIYGASDYTARSISLRPYWDAADGQAAVVIRQGGADALVAEFPAPAAGVWHSYVLSLDGAAEGRLRLWVDGEAVVDVSADGIGANEIGNDVLRLNRWGSSVASNLDVHYRDLRIFAAAIPGPDVGFLSAENAQFAADAAFSTLPADGATLTTHLALPAGVTFTVPDGQTVLAADGTLTPPEGTGPVTVSLTATFRGISATREYQVVRTPAQTPTITPAAGSYHSPQTVTLSSPQQGAELYYTVDGSQPSVESGTRYSEPFVVGDHGSEGALVRAIAVVPGQSASTVAAADIFYTAWAATATVFRLAGDDSATNAKIVWEARSDADMYRVYRGSGEQKMLVGQTTGDLIDDYDLALDDASSYTVEAYAGGAVLATTTSNTVHPFTPEDIVASKDNITGKATGSTNEDGPTGMLIDGTYYQYTFASNGAAGADKTLEIREARSSDGFTFSAPETIYSVADRRIEGGGFTLNPATGKVIAHGHLELTTPGTGYTYASYLLAQIAPGTGTVTVWQDEAAEQGKKQRPFGLDTKDQSFFVDGQTAYVLAAVNGNSDTAIIRLDEHWAEPAEYALAFRGEGRETPSIIERDGTYYFFSSRAAGWYPSQTAYASSTEVMSGWSPLRPLGNAAGFDAQFNHVQASTGESRTTDATMSWHWGANRNPASPVGTITRALPLSFHGGFASSEWFSQVDYDRTYGHVPVQAGRNLAYGAPVTDPLAVAGANVQLLTDGADHGAGYISHTAAGYQVTVDLEGMHRIDELDFTTRLVNGSETLYKFTFEVSSDGTTWTEIVDGRENVYTGFVPTRLEEPVTARFVRFTALDWPKVNGPRAFDGLYEIAVLGQPGTPAEAEPVTQAEDVRVATPTGAVPDLPAAVLFDTTDGTQQPVPVTWDLDGYTFSASYEAYTVHGATAAGVAATATVHAVPATLRYLIDAGSAVAGSPVFDAVKARLGGELLQEKSDQQYTSVRSWGFVPQSGTDGPVVRPAGSENTVTADLGERILASRTPTLEYRVHLPAAGTYTITAATTELWANQNRNMRFRFTDTDGTATDIGAAVTTNSVNQRVQVTGTVTASAAGVATIAVTRTSGSANPQIAWLAVAEGDISVTPVTVAAPRLIPGGSTLSQPTAVEIRGTTPGAVYYYTLDGSTPTRATGIRYTAPFQVSDPVTVKAIAWSDGKASSVVEGSYTFTDDAGPYDAVPVGQPWFDTDGNLIQAHGGGFLEHDGWYWWVGENKAHHGASFYAVSLYRSKDLLNWDFVRDILTPESATGDDAARLAFGEVKVERPKLLYNEATDTFVLWGHWETAASYGPSRLVVATSDTIDGLYTYQDDFRPGEGEAWAYGQRAAIQALVTAGTHPDLEAAEAAYRAEGNTPAGYESRDFTVYKDPDSAAAYLISAEAHHNLRIYPLSADYTTTDWENSYPLFAGESREAAAVIKSDGVFYLFSSGQSGWYANQLKYAYTADLSSPDGWSQNRNVGNNTTFKSQPTFIMDIPKSDGGHSYVYMGDRWTPAQGLGNSTYVWLPLTIGADPAADVDISYTDGWSLDVDTGEIVLPTSRLVSERKSASSSSGQASAGYTDPATPGYIDNPVVTANPAAAANDGVTDSASRFDNSHYWKPTGSTPYTWQVDLAEPVALSRLDISWRSYNGSETYSTYNVYGSVDGSTWELLADRTGNRVVGFTSDDLDGRYQHVRIEILSTTNDHNGSGASWATGLVEVQVYGTPVAEIPITIEVTGTGPVNVGGTRALAATAHPVTADNTVRWESSDETVATVTGDGVVSGIAAGTAQITATSIHAPDAHATVTITVAAAPPPPAAWDASNIYVAGDRVQHDGYVYVAQWWTQNQSPTASPYGSWARVGAPVGCDVGEVLTWTNSWVYTGGETVADDGRLWRAKWWTRNQTPGDPSGPWQDLGPCRAG